jgi:hypothetical protein
MKLRLSRSQKITGVMSSNVTFCLDARAELTPEEAEDVKKYKLGKQVLYSSEAAKRRFEKGISNLTHGGVSGLVKGAAGLAMQKLTLNVTIDSLTHGHHIEAAEMSEMLGAEEALKSSCEDMKRYLAIAATFNGEEQVLEY